MSSCRGVAGAAGHEVVEVLVTGLTPFIRSGGGGHDVPGRGGIRLLGRDGAVIGIGLNRWSGRRWSGFAR